MSYLRGPRATWLLPVLLLAGCQTVPPAPHAADNTRSYCASPQVFTTDTLGPAPTPRPGPDTTALPPLSARSWQLARAYNLEPALSELAHQRRPPTGPMLPDYLAFMQQRQTVVLTVARATGDALRVAGELECERQRAEQTAVALQALTTKRTNRFTASSLVLGAASGVISASVQNNPTNLVLTVITAGISAGLGVGALLVGPQLPYPQPGADAGRSLGGAQ